MKHATAKASRPSRSAAKPMRTAAKKVDARSAPKKSALRSPPPPKAVSRPSLTPMPTIARPVRQPEQTLARSFYYCDLHVGDELPFLVRGPIDRLQIARFSGAVDDYNPLHLDEQRARAAGFPGVLAPPLMTLAFSSQQVMGWLRRGRLVRFGARFVKLLWPGDTVTCRARVAALRKEDGLCFAELDLWAENHRGELVLRGSAVAELVESQADAPRTLAEGLRFSAHPPASSRPKPRRR